MNIFAPSIWFCGLSGAGKTSSALSLQKAITEKGKPAVLLDGDDLRNGLCSDLSFSEQDRKENIRRVREVALLLSNAGIISIVPCINPFESERLLVQRKFGKERYYLIYADAPFEVCEKRDSKGLYQKARQGLIKNFTGLDGPFEAPTDYDLKIGNKTLSEITDIVLNTPMFRQFMCAIST